MMTRIRQIALGFGLIAFLGCGQPVGPPPKGPGKDATADAKEKPDAKEKKAAEDHAEAKAKQTPEPGAPTDAGGPEVVEIADIYTLPADDGSETKLTVEEIQAFADDEGNHRPIVPASPVGLPDVSSYIPADNPMTRAKVELGRMLYFDPRLSRDETVSCASCHDPDKGWTDGAPVSTGIDGQKGGRSAPTVMNRIFGKTQFWDGRSPTLEDQALGPIQNPIEMGFTLDELVERLKGIEGYRVLFEKTFGDVTPDAIAKAIASFERTVLVGGSPNDYYTQAELAMKLSAEDLEDEDPEVQATVKANLAAAEAHPMSEAALRGRALYFSDRGQCSTCHVGHDLSDELFYNIGVGALKPEPDKGRVAVSKDEKDTGAFKTPSLRNTAKTAPYMHDGSQKTLKEVIVHYNKGGHKEGNPHQHKRIKKLELSDEEVADLEAFLVEGLSGPMPPISRPRLP